MDYRFLGVTGIKVSELALGTQTFGWVAEERAAQAIADRYVEAGGNLFDTADIYNQGASESILGAWLKSRGGRDRLFIASKVFFPSGDGPNDSGLSRKHLFRSIEASLKRLQTDYLDLYQAHCFDYTTRMEETLRGFDDLVRGGKVRSIGVSNWTASQLQKAVLLARAAGWAPPACLQAEYSLIVRETEWELLPLCQQEDLGFLAWSPLAGGWLSGKYRRDQRPPENSRVGRRDRWDDQPEQRAGELTWRVLDALRRVSGERGRSPAQVALNWLLCRSPRVVPILGCRTVEQLEENLGGCGWRLSAEELAGLDAASDAPRPYPYRFIERYAKRG